MSDDTILDMRKSEKTVPVHARISESDVAEVDKAASEQAIPVSRSYMLAIIVRQWADKRRPPKKKA